MMVSQGAPEATAAAEASFWQRTIANCCCVGVVSRAEVRNVLLAERAPEPSLLARCCLCKCSAEERVANGLQDIPGARGFAGITVQDGSVIDMTPTQNALETTKWALFDKGERTLLLSPYGRFGGPPGSSGAWTAPPNLGGALAINAARLCGYSYRLRFSEDFRQTTFQVLCNLCCCLPCVPPVFPAPMSLVRFEATQTERSRDGTEWLRQSFLLGNPMANRYLLRTVHGPDGSPGPYAVPEGAPQVYFIAR